MICQMFLKEVNDQHSTISMKKDYLILLYAWLHLISEGYHYRFDIIPIFLIYQ